MPEYWKKTTTLPSVFAYAGIPYHVLGWDTASDADVDTKVGDVDVEAGDV